MGNFDLNSHKTIAIMMPKIVCDDKIPFLRGVFEPWAEVVYLPGAAISRADVAGADALVTRTRTPCTRELLEGSRVRVIASATIGYDHIDTAWCEAHGIRWFNAPGCNASSVSQYVCSALCVLARDMGLDLGKTTLGVVGAGNVGSRVASAARALGMKVLLCDPPRARREGTAGFTDIGAIVAQSDIISLHVPLIRSGEDRTEHLFDARMLSRMRPDQILINTSRGQVVDCRALKAALEESRIAAAVLDVWEGEPGIDSGLLDAVAIGTPHIAGYSADGKAAGTAAAVRAVSRVLGLPAADWSPAEIPAPRRNPVLGLECGTGAVMETVSEAVLYAYDVREDSLALKRSPGLFEKLRGDYPVRREPSAFEVRLSGGAGAEAARVLSALGFRTGVGR